MPDYYGDPNPADTKQPKPEVEENGDSEGEYKPVTIPKDFCQTKMKAGDVFKARVVEVLEDQYLVQYEPEGEEEEGEEHGKETAEGTAPAEPPSNPGGDMGGGGYY